MGALAPDGALSLDSRKFLDEVTPRQSPAIFEESVGAALARALERSGLFRDEAEAMVGTWKLSYFRTEGLRVLYILPREETDAILPLAISPKPAALVRTLVGRVEILTKREEETLLADVIAMRRGATPSGTLARSTLESTGRFREPKLARVRQLTSDPGLQDFIRSRMQ